MIERIGKYHVIRAAGSGGFGTVYEGYDVELDRNVAIKICTAAEETQLERFMREARIVSKLRHRNIALVHDFGFDEETGLHFLVEEFLSGVDLEKKLQDQDRLPPSLRVSYLRELAQGLSFVHEEGLIHRDLTPRNIRILHDHSIKIMDFGLSRDIGDSTLTHIGDNFGTVGYTAPEQIIGMRAVDHRTDIFSFGVIAYELLSFQNPFAAETMGDFLHKIHHCEPVPLSELWSECPLPLHELVHKCIRKAPEDRFASCSEFLPVLKKMIRYLRDNDIPAPAAPVDEREPVRASGRRLDPSAPGWPLRLSSGPQGAGGGTVAPPRKRVASTVPVTADAMAAAGAAAPAAKRRPKMGYVYAAIVTAVLAVAAAGILKLGFGSPPTTAGELAQGGAAPVAEPTFELVLRSPPGGARVDLEAVLPATLEGLSHCYVLRTPAWSYGAKVRTECGAPALRYGDRIEVAIGGRYTYQVQLAGPSGEVLTESAPVAIVAGE